MPNEVRASAATEYRQIGGLLGFLVKAEVDALFKQQPFKTASGEDPADLWRRFDHARAQLEPVLQGQFEPLAEDLADAERSIRRRSTFKEYYEAVADYSFGTVPIASLLAPQWFADLDYIDEMAAKLSSGLSPDEQLRFALSEGSIHQPIIAGNTVLFSSPRRDLHADQVPRVTQTAEGEFEIVVRATSRPNYVQVAVIGDRLVLTNGVHKVCALHKAGFTRCYCVARQAHNLVETGLNVQTTLFRDQIFGSVRPAIVTDFLNALTAVPLQMRSMNQILQIAIQSGTLTVPALPRETK
jgi:hypothetical protein